MKPRASRRTQKRRQTSRRQARATNAGLVQEITGVLLVALGVWLYFSLSRLGGGQIGDWFADLLANLFGLLRWVVPGGLIGLGFYLIVIRRRPIAAGRLWGLLLLFFAASSAFHFHHHPSVMFAPNNLPRGGGYLGALLAYPLTLGLGEAGRWVFVVAAGLIGCLLVTQGSLGAFLQAGGERAVRRGRSFADLLRDFWALLTRRPDGEEPGPAHRRRSGLPPEYQAEVSGPRLSPPAAQPSLWGAAAEPWGGQPAHAEPIVRGAGVDPEPPEVSPAQGPLPDPAVVEAEATAPATVEPDHPEEPSATASQAAAQAEATREGGEGAAGPVAEGASPAPAAGPAPQPRPYQLPPVKLLGPGSRKNQGDSHKEVLARSQLLERTLATFGVEAKVLEVHVGPAITRFELQPAPGVKVSRIVNLADDLALNLAATDVRIEAPIPGKAAVGIEVPNNERAAVLLRDVVESREFQESPAKLPIALGKDIAGRPVVGALEKMPHLLIAGATGSGKSVCMNTIILSILMKAKPDEVKMLMVDPKMVELSMYNGIPHLAAPVCTDPRKAAGYLKWAVKEMENRYELFAAAGVRDLTRYNELVARDPGPDPDNPRQPLPYIVILIDELADLMMVAPGEVEDAICRLAQMARACGMHLVIATQRPSVDVITGLIKANIPSRIAFAVSSQVDSRTILDMGGAEKLLGRGDMLYYPVGKSKPERAQGAFIDEKEVEAVVQFVEAQGKPEFQAEALEVETKGNGGAAAGDGGFDPALAEAVRIIIEEERASVSVLQRRLRVNYTKAARLIDDMFEQGWIGPHNGPRPREVYITMPQWQEIFGGGSDEVAAAEEG